MSLVRFPQINPKGAGPWADIELRTNTGVFISPLNGVTRTLERQGARWAMTLRYQSLAGADRDRLRAFIASMMGQANRCYVRDFSYTQRGSFTQSQVLTEPDFDNGGAGWTDTTGTSGEVSYQENAAILRRFVRSNTAVAISEGSITTVTGVPYLARAMFFDIGGSVAVADIYGHSSSGSAGEYFVTSSADLSPSLEAPARHVAPFVPHSTSISFFARLSTGDTPTLYDDKLLISDASVSRCALIDIPENLLTYSEQFDNAAWTKTRSSISANAGNFGGEAIADELIEDGTASQTHFLEQTYTKSSDEEMATFSVYVRRATGSRDVVLRISDSGGGDTATAYFDLDTGTLDSVASTGNYDLERGTIEALPNIGESGWYRCTISGLTDTDTSIVCSVFMSDAAPNLFYNGDSSSSLYLFGAQLQFSHIAGFYQQTTSSALLASSASSPGNKVPLKGLPSDTNGLLLPGDMVELIPVSGPTGSIRSHMARLVAPLDSDEGGKGYMRIEPGLQWTPDITNRYRVSGSQVGIRIEPCVSMWRPEGRFMLDQESVREIWDANDRVSIEFTLVEDVAA